jgi:hypothetical protein
MRRNVVAAGDPNVLSAPNMLEEASKTVEPTRASHDSGMEAD